VEAIVTKSLHRRDSRPLGHARNRDQPARGVKHQQLAPWPAR